MTQLRVRGEVRAPGDKSISHRALILSAIARGRSRITNILDSADVRCTAQALRAFGASIPPLSNEIMVTGIATRIMRSPADPVDCGNSGTTARLLAGVAAGAGLRVTLVGDASLSRRPMRRIAEPLRAMGASIRLSARDTLPMGIQGGPLREIEWEPEVASAQVKSAILLAALLGGVRAQVHEPNLSRDHTERMMIARGVEVTRNGSTVELAPAQVIRPADTRVPADPSSAAFFIALALLASEGELELPEVCLNRTRTGFLGALRRMGAQIEIIDRREEDGEPLGTIVARPSQLSGITIAASDVPAMIDELPLLACVAARATGELEVRGAAELRVKESDRITTLVENLRAIGVRAEELPDGFRVTGSRKALRGTVRTRADHRIAMAFGILGALPENDIHVDDGDCVDVSFPGFWTTLQGVVQ